MTRTIIYESKQEKYPPWRGEVCKRCGQPNFVGYNLDDRAWDLISGHNYYSILCIPCLDRIATLIGLDWVKHLQKDADGECLYPCSTIGWND